MLGCRRLKHDDVALIIAKCNVSVSQETRDPHALITGEPRHLAASENIPNNCCVASIVADRKSTGPSVTAVVDLHPQNILAVQVESSLNCQAVMVEYQYQVALGVQQERGSRSAWFEV
jgi:hypothetical protein